VTGGRQGWGLPELTDASLPSLPSSLSLSLASKKEGWCQDEDEKKNGIGGIASGGEEYLWGANCR